MFDGAGGVAKAASNDKKDQMDVEAIFDVTIVSGLNALDAVSKEHAVDAAIGKGILHVWDARFHIAFSDFAQRLGVGASVLHDEVEYLARTLFKGLKQRLGKVTGFGVNDFARDKRRDRQAFGDEASTVTGVAGHENLRGVTVVDATE